MTESSLEDRILAKLSRNPGRFLPLSALPGPTYLAERELTMAEGRGEVERREFDGIPAWRTLEAVADA
jgi:hypothetical protein